MICGELSLFNDARRSATIVALTKMKVARINANALEKFLDAQPDIGYRFLKEMLINITAILRKTDERMISFPPWGLRAHSIDQQL